MTMVLEETTGTARIALLSDDAAFLETFALALSSTFGRAGAKVSEATDLADLLTLLASERTANIASDLVLMDVSMRDASGLAGLLYLRTQFPGVPVLVTARSADATFAHRCLRVGAAGFLPHGSNVDEVVDAIRSVMAGEVSLPERYAADDGDTAEANEILRRLHLLTPQQLRVLTMLTQGLLNKQIAYELKVSEATIKAHVSAILLKLDVDGRARAVAAVAKLGFGTGAVL